MAIGAVFPVTIMAQYKGRLQRDMLGVERSVNKAGKAAEGAQGSFKNLAGAFTGLLVAGKVRDVFVSILKPAADLEMAFARLRGLTGLSTKKLGEFRVEAMRVAGITPYGPVEVSNALLKLQQSSGSAKESMRALAATTQVAMASMGTMQLEESSKMMGEMMRVFNLSGEQAAVGANAMFGAAKSMGLSIAEYKDIMGKLGVASVRGNQSFVEMVKAFTLVRRAGISSQQAVTGLIRIMGELQKGKGIAAFKQIGVDPIDATTGALRPLSEILVDLTDRYQKFGNRTREAFDEAFRERSMKTALSMIAGMTRGIKNQAGETLKAGEALDYLSKNMQKSGQLQKMSDLYLQTLSASWETLKEEFVKIAINIGSFLMPVMKDLAAGVKGLAGWINSLMAVPVLGWVLKLGVMLGTMRVAWIAITAALQGVRNIIKVVLFNLREAIVTEKAEAAATAQATVAKNAYAAASTRAAAALGKENAARVAGMAGASKMPTPAEYAAGQKLGRETGTIPAGLRRPKAEPFGGTTTVVQLNRRARALQAVKTGFGAVAGAAKTAGSAIMAFLGGPIGIIVGLTAAIVAYRKEIRDFINESSAIQDAAKKIQGAFKASFARYGIGEEAIERSYQKQRELGGLRGAMFRLFTSKIDIARRAHKEANKAVQETYDKVYKTMKKSADALKASLQIGGKIMNESLDRIDKMATYEPPDVKWGRFYKLERQMAKVGALRQVRPEDRIRLQRTMELTGRMQQMMREAKLSGRRLSPAQFREMGMSAMYVRSAAQYFQKEYKGTVTKGAIEAYSKDFVKQLTKMGRPETQEFMRQLAVTGEGAVGGIGLPGWKTRTAGYGEAPTGPVGATIAAGGVMGPAREQMAAEQQAVALAQQGNMLLGQVADTLAKRAIRVNVIEVGAGLTGTGGGPGDEGGGGSGLFRPMREL
jgi:TP901 family phage tail tape measure protein